MRAGEVDIIIGVDIHRDINPTIQTVDNRGPGVVDTATTPINNSTAAAGCAPCPATVDYRATFRAIRSIARCALMLEEQAAEHETELERLVTGACHAIALAVQDAAVTGSRSPPPTNGSNASPPPNTQAGSTRSWTGCGASRC